MDFDIHLRNLFALRGVSATYTPGVGGAAGCRAIRQGGGRSIQLGAVRVVVERTQYHVRRAEVSAPAPGDTLAIGSDLYTVEAIQPVERDADRLMWCLEVAWGAAVVYRSVAGSGVSQNPPQGSSFVIASGLLAGVSAVSIKAGFAVGKLLPGDNFTISGDGTEYAVTGSGVQATQNAFLGVPISPQLAADADAAAVVTFSFAREYAVRAGVAAYGAREIGGGVQVGDRRLIVLQANLDAATMTGEPKAGDRVTIGSRAYTVVTAAALYAHAAPYAWDIQVRA